MMSRKSIGGIQIDQNLRCLKIYPLEGTQKEVRELKTIGIQLSREQAIHLARALLAASQDWKTIDITGYRFKKRRSDNTFHLTVTSHQED
jgi:hypothetical protein